MYRSNFLQNQYFSISLVVEFPKKQGFWTKINILKGNRFIFRSRFVKSILYSQKVYDPETITALILRHPI